MAKTVLVTGGAGYIGSHCCKLLARKGYAPVAYDNLSRGHREFVKWGPLCVGDINDRQTLLSVLAKHKPVAVLHFAALAYVGESVEQPLRYYENNLGGTLSLLGALAKSTVKYFILSSSCATYGIPDIVPIQETAPQKPVNPYGFTKLAAERMITDCARDCGLSYTFLRYFNAAGAYNLGYGRGYSVRELCDVVRKVSGKSFPIINKPRRRGDPPELVADPSEAFAALGWKPEWDNLERIVQTAWEWSRKKTGDTSVSSVHRRKQGTGDG